MTPIEKFQNLLRELFQFDCADLDFGIYRIMNHKRAVIEHFIAEDLPQAIAEELSRGALAEQAQAAQELQTAKKKVLDTLGEDALDADGNLAVKYHETRAGREYLEAQTKAKGARSTEALEAAIYNHLYAFFSRYWQDGDFISKRRYSKKERYAIPYNGEEVYLYWANHDQYYVKTGEYFTDYTYQAPSGVTVHFKLRQADVEQNNVKGEKRFFLPVLGGIAWDEAARTLTIPFEFRPLTEQENIAYGQKNQQEAILAKAVDEIPKRVKAADALDTLTRERRKSEKGETVTYLEHHLRQYTRRNTSDFFIHKDLRGFLSRELDFYLKNEVLNLEEMEAAGEALAEGWFQLLRLIKRIGGRVIEFLAQIEDFQKTLWEKKKFITETFYVVTVGNIPGAFYTEIAANGAQWEEWQTLLAVEAPKAAGKRVELLKAHPTLPLDTRHFPQDFTDRLLAAFEDLDEMTDGLLVHAENWQALNLLQEKYRERVKCIYIDPPYNTGSDEFLYRDAYQHSSWLAMMYDRLVMMHCTMKRDGTFFTSIDHNEISSLKGVLDCVFQNDNLEGIISWRRRHNQPNDRTKMIGLVSEYLLAYAKEGSALRKSGVGKLDITGEFSNPDNDPRGDWASKPWKVGAGQSGTRYVIETPSGKKLDEEWMGDESTYRALLADSRIIFPRDGDGFPRKKYFKSEREEEGQCATNWWEYSYFGHNAGANATMTALFGEKNLINNPKPVELLRGVVQVAGRVVDLVADFFAGSGTTGHAVINLNREDGGRRKFILVEMAQYFDTVLLPRIKKVTFTPEWKDGKPKRMATAEEAARSPRLVKVIRLESYEDALNNLTFDEESGQQALKLFGDEYLLSYMLRWETRHSETLLNVEQLQSPFSYRLHIHRDLPAGQAGGETHVRPVDLPETFAYLLGLDVQTRKVYDDGGRRYLVYRGAFRNGRAVAVLWRETQGWTAKDYRRDAAFVAEHNLAAGADEVWVNGDSLIPGARSLDPIFKERMFAGVEA
ncbi:MAG TPA: site-specific DNA-methyltransferase [Termitinemataceae bacterium]|nr:site-specific DNA-methyltransferase [Termitinemataceae bacterium]